MRSLFHAVVVFASSITSLSVGIFLTFPAGVFIARSVTQAKAP